MQSGLRGNGLVEIVNFDGGQVGAVLVDTSDGNCNQKGLYPIQTFVIGDVPHYASTTGRQYFVEFPNGKNIYNLEPGDPFYVVDCKRTVLFESKYH